MKKQQKTDSFLNNEIQQWYDSSQVRAEWDFANKILYKMCKDHQGWTSENIVAGKILLIGRSYAAALERNKKKTTKEDIYQVAAKAIINTTNKHDKKISELISKSKIRTNGQMHSILEAVHFLNTILRKFSGQNKISLSSKLLHFHNPDIPIYDSISKNALYALISRKDLKKYPDLFDLTKNSDKYSTHLARFYYLKRELKLCGYKNPTAREIDNFLIYWWI